VADVFEEEAAGPGPHGVVDVFVEVKGGEDEHAALRAGGDELAGSFQAVEHWHANVHEHHIRVLFGGDGEGLLTVGGLADDLDVGLHVKKQPETGAHQLLIVGQYDTNHDPDRSTGSGRRARTVNPPPSPGPA
jgi:hypothetical protein